MSVPATPTTDKHIGYHELREALRKEGCALCCLVRKEVRRYMDNMLYERVNDPGVRGGVRMARGFCNLHAWQLYEEHDALGTAILYRDVLQDVAKGVTGPAPSTSLGPGILQRLRQAFQVERRAPSPADLAPRQTCPACRVREDTERIYGETLLAHLADAELRADLARADGLCLPHLRQVLAMADREAAETLIAIQQAIWKRLLGELDEFIRKQDYRFREEPIGSERDSWIRALALVSGRPGVR